MIAICYIIYYDLYFLFSALSVAFYMAKTRYKHPPKNEEYTTRYLCSCSHVGEDTAGGVAPSIHRADRFTRSTVPASCAADPTRETYHAPRPEPHTHTTDRGGNKMTSPDAFCKQKIPTTKQFFLVFQGFS